jgi:hypothetical protein
MSLGVELVPPDPPPNFSKVRCVNEFEEPRNLDSHSPKRQCEPTSTEFAAVQQTSNRAAVWELAHTEWSEARWTNFASVFRTGPRIWNYTNKFKFKANIW